MHDGTVAQPAANPACIPILHILESHLPDNDGSNLVDPQHVVVAEVEHVLSPGAVADREKDAFDAILDVKVRLLLVPVS